MSSLIAAYGFIGMLTGTACPPSIPPNVEMTVDVQPLHLATDYDRADILALAHEVGTAGDKSPVGFFTATLSYKIELFEGARSGDGCPPEMRVELTALLDHRVIEIARDLPNAKCSIPAAVGHYRQIATADELTVKSQAEQLLHDFKAKLTNALSRADRPSSNESHRDFIVGVAKSVVDGNSQKTFERRKQAHAAARASDDIDTAVRSCGST